MFANNPPPIDQDAAYWRQKYEEALHLADVRQDEDRTLTNEESTVLVNIWSTGTVEVAFRENPSATWGPPVTVMDR